jgi:hypothetical protein
MSNWLHSLPVVWLALLVFGITFLVSAAIYGTVRVFAKGEFALGFKGIAPGLLSPLGVLFGLLIIFTASEVWNDNDQANLAVDREATGLRAAFVLSAALPGEPGAELRAQIRLYSQEVTTKEWPLMAAGTARLGTTAPYLSRALVSTLTAVPGKDAQQAVQAGIVSSLEAVLDARRQRILISERQVNLTKWICILIEAACVLFAIAMIHTENRLTAILAMGLFATGVAASVLLILAYDRPFVGQLAVGPEPLLEATIVQ